MSIKRFCFYRINLEIKLSNRVNRVQFAEAWQTTCVDPQFPLRVPVFFYTANFNYSCLF